MKKKIIFLAFLVATCLGYNAHAQISVHFNIGLQPLWGPVGYDYVEYYYMPDIDAYYDVPNRNYIYMDNGQWITVRSLPPRYRTIDIYTIHKEVINEPAPWKHHEKYRNQYIKYKGNHSQQVIRNSHEEKYWQNPRHPQHNQWRGNGGGNGGPKHAPQPRQVREQRSAPAQRQQHEQRSAPAQRQEHGRGQEPRGGHDRGGQGQGGGKDHGGGNGQGGGKDHGGGKGHGK